MMTKKAVPGRAIPRTGTIQQMICTTLPRVSLDPEGAAVCDFCVAQRPRWEFPCRTFSRTVGGDPRFRVVFYEPWAACPPCHPLVEAERWAALRRRVVALYRWLPPGSAEELTATWMQFSMHRIGPARRIGSGR